jgi:hypothetical protein
MSQRERPHGFKAGIAIGAAIALLGVAIGITVASIPAANGSIYGCANRTTGALRVIDYPSRHCSSSERLLRWNQPSAPATVSLSALEGTPCRVAPNQTAVLHADINSASGVVTLRCASTLRVTGSATLTRILISSGLAGASVECDNAKACSLGLPFGTPDAEVLLFAASDFDYTCPGATRQGSFADVSRTFWQAQCLSIQLSGDKSVVTFAK